MLSSIALDRDVGSPLVPIYGLSAEEGLNDRIDLRDFLADQWSLTR